MAAASAIFLRCGENDLIVFKCMFKHTLVGVSQMVKTITIRDEVYRKLITIKRKGESFSELFERLAECQDSRQTLTKLRASIEFENKEEMLSELANKRAERRT